MRKYFYLFSVLLLSFTGHTQILFEEGYYIDTDNRKVDCLIRFVDWKNNPAGFDYKLTPDGDVKRASVADVNGFGVRDVVKYVRATVDMDRSTEEVAKLTTDRNPVFRKEELFLNVLVEGEASLYAYIEGNLSRFFIRKGDGRIDALVYKLYKTSDGRVARNNFYQKQLLDNLGCHSIKENSFQSLKYNTDNLVRFFVAYNRCSGDEPVTYRKKKGEQDYFNLSLRPRLNRSSFSISNSAEFYKFDAVDYGSKFDFGLGVDAEFILPFFRNKWAVALEPTYYRGIKGGKTVEGVEFLRDRELIMEINLRSIELPIGVRYYMFLNEKSKLSIDAYYMYDFGSKSRVDFSGAGSSFYDGIKLAPKPTVIFGLGYKFNNRLSLEARYYLKRDLAAYYLYWHSDYNSASLALGISLF